MSMNAFTVVTTESEDPLYTFLDNAQSGCALTSDDELNLSMRLSEGSDAIHLISASDLSTILTSRFESHIAAGQVNTWILLKRPEVLFELLKTYAASFDPEIKERAFDLLVHTSKDLYNPSLAAKAEQNLCIGFVMKILPREKLQEIPNLLNRIERREEGLRDFLGTRGLIDTARRKIDVVMGVPSILSLSLSDFESECPNLLLDPRLLRSILTKLYDQLVSTESPWEVRMDSLQRLYKISDAYDLFLKQDPVDALSIVLSTWGHSVDLYDTLLANELDASVIPDLVRSGVGNPYFHEASSKMLAYGFCYGMIGGPYRNHFLFSVKSGEIPEKDAYELVREVGGEEAARRLKESLKNSVNETERLLTLPFIKPGTSKPKLLFRSKEREFEAVIGKLYQWHFLNDDGVTRARMIQEAVLAHESVKESIDPNMSFIRIARAVLEAELKTIAPRGWVFPDYGLSKLLHFIVGHPLGSDYRRIARDIFRTLRGEELDSVQEKYFLQFIAQGIIAHDTPTQETSNGNKEVLSLRVAACIAFEKLISGGVDHVLPLPSEDLYLRGVAFFLPTPDWKLTKQKWFIVTAWPYKKDNNFSVVKYSRGILTVPILIDKRSGYALRLNEVDRPESIGEGDYQAGSWD